MKKVKIISIVGARPQFIKAATISNAILKYNRKFSLSIIEKIIHTGQHYDKDMSNVFFQDLKIPKPHHFLNINQKSHGAMTGQMIEKIEHILIREMPEYVLLYGDTNSTLSGALAASKLNIPVAHIEAGLRSYNKEMPEEINRVITDHISTILFCPTKQAVINLRNEGLTKNVYQVGDVMYDSMLYQQKKNVNPNQTLKKLNIESKNYVLATIHRAENTDNQQKLKTILFAFENISKNLIQIVMPIHPRTKKMIECNEIKPEYIKIINPVSYLEMIELEKESKIIITDSGGIQKEAYWLRIPCITLRDETEWLETINDNWNQLVEVDSEKIYNAVKGIKQGKIYKYHYGSGNAAEKIINILADEYI